MTDAMLVRKQERLYQAAAILLAVFLGAYQVVTATMFYEQVRWPENVTAAGFSLGAPWPSVRAPGPRALEAGLQAGDRVVAVQGVPFAGETTVDRALEKLFPGDRLRLTVTGADGAAREISWQLDKQNDGASALGRILFLLMMAVGMPLVCLVVGFWTVLARPRDPQAWLLLGMLACFGHSVVHPGPFPPSLGVLGDVFHVLHTAMNGSWALFMFLFAWVFPRRMPWQERGWVAVWVVGAALVGCVGVLTLRDILRTWGDPAVWASSIDVLDGLMGKVQLIQMTGIGCFFALTSYKRFALDDTESRRRLGTILTGAAIALSPLFLLLLWSLVLGKNLSGAAAALIVPAILAMCVFPVTLGYVIVVHRAFGLGVALRQGLQYALAQRGIRIVQVMLVLGVMLTAVAMASQPGMNRPKILQVVAGGTIVVLFLQRGAERLAGWVDKRFFRDAYHAEQVLADLSEEVRTIVETRPLLETVGTRIGEALRVEKLLLLLREGAQFAPAYAYGFGEGKGAALPATARTAELLQMERAPLRVYLDDTNSWVYREGLAPEETAWLGACGSELLLPLAVKDKLLGFVSLGKKMSDEPYTPNDLRLLRSVATQTGLALENSHLAAAITEAVAQREVLNREVEIAQEVQQRLFPQNLPEIPGLDYFGYCRPALGVGGDSYDFLPLERSIFGISIGDVSGKGIPAALLMASLQSALRGQAMSMPPDLGVMMGTLNRLIYDSSPSNRYATLFYGQFDPATRMLTYVNGGHNPPMVVRGESILRLEDGGPVVGLFRPARFSQGSVRIEPGDVLVGFTDGVSEAMDAADEEWGEEALGEFLLKNPGATARELIPRIMAAADAFVKGAPQHDDMTLVVVRFL